MCECELRVSIKFDFCYKCIVVIGFVYIQYKMILPNGMWVGV